MLLPPKGNILTKGFCWGEDNCRLDDESRLCFHKENVKRLSDHDVVELYRCPDPTGVRFLLCPPKNWKILAAAIEQHFARSQELDEAMRLWCSGTPVGIDNQGRIRITAICLNHAKLGPGTRARVLGVGYYYEVSQLQQFSINSYSKYGQISGPT